MNLIIDVGNTRVKAAVFEKDTLVELVFFDKRRILSEIKKIVKKYSISKGIMSNVASISDLKLKKLQKIVQIRSISSSTKVPFKNLYKTPKTLGVDRIALVAGAVSQFLNKNVLVIDAGTCITFDFVNSKGEYLGGAISPGIKMRFNSLNYFTANLPLLEKEEVCNFIGSSTKESMNSGIVNGVIQEIDGIINQYKKKYYDLTVVLTGGDTNFLSKQLKSSIFANQNFLLQGLNKILIFNIDK
ncbi:type III pantothenate kinase [Polaribacter sp. Hel1_85]|uniref:type III pantothenate kinase n=1 Tax=Polaribacter sp. Hel1_85 TaxID=1250005 RepID=UPI00052C4F93|nr:type III pantothenate kinase [Polaribacter sp. Hel1_85]KGL61893.1 pantothenate kinase type III, CoaX-like protein [Polaribacter sp. Hel1_85]